ncbi:MAG: ABC transporter substrate-binding protein [Comamonas sp. SCN 67-35]|mgnify:FL=1|uniref:ABC transporter substrate-binding protein n=1 Tax=unclassified Comamonas TaxID=2638500 RepID=UPI00086B8E7D|nr:MULTISPECIES: ABC transporter substrate-binding protein [unclassified Comamonas]MBN9330672.1 ABC transporter substrate-binding protein [Comamonas sp.]ODU39913.1 MAG: ABC transporter substrate-binding protein [Comamonas sp. SCN 67-35]OJW97975.1 MAG: ABC transporter substrate-binding protein [Burkholderiales bacterium 66-26]
MRFVKTVIQATLVASALASAGLAQAKDLTIGLVLSVSGPFADYGKQIKHGIDVYMAQHGDTVAGRKVKLIVKDDTGMAPQVAKRMAQELLVNDKVDILAGFDLTPNAFSAAPLATQAKVPMVVMNAATSSVTEKSPYIVRVSMTLPQGAWAMAKWAAENNIKSAYTLVADYGPGHDAEVQFKKTFTELGGKIVGEVRTPVNTADYAAYLERVKDAKPGAMFTFVPPGSSMVALMKGFRELGLDKAGIQAIGPGDLTDENELAAMGNSALGLVTAFHYSQAHDSPENKAYVAAYLKAFPKDRPNFMSVGGYDGMHLIYQVLEKTKGDASGDAFVAAAKGLQWTSPRGPVQIDPETRDIIQNEYIRKLENVNGEVQNVEFATLKAVKDPGKAAK